MTRIQFKIYDETGRRHHLQEITIPVSLSAATDYIKAECLRLQNIKYPPISVAPHSGNNSSCTLSEKDQIQEDIRLGKRTYADPLTEMCHQAEKILYPNRIENHHSPTGSAPEAFQAKESAFRLFKSPIPEQHEQT